MAISKGTTAEWTKSSYSGGNGACVEVKSPAVQAIDVRDSKAPEGPSIAFTPGVWTSFIAEVGQGSLGRG